PSLHSQQFDVNAFHFTISLLRCLLRWCLFRLPRRLATKTSPRGFDLTTVPVNWLAMHSYFAALDLIAQSWWETRPLDAQFLHLAVWFTAAAISIWRSFESTSPSFPLV